MKNITQWQHYKKNYLVVTVLFVAMAIIGFFTVEPEIWYVPIVFLFIGLVLIPIGNYLSWKGKLD